VTEAEFAVLNAVYLKKLASVTELAELTETPVAAVDALVVALSDRDLVMATAAGTLLSEAGRAAVVDYYADTYGSARTDQAVIEWYERFESLNSRFIALVTDWQRSGGDAAVQERLIKVVERLVSSLDDLIVRIPRYDSYGRRFNLAIARVDAGDADLVANPRRDSLHNIWFELHEDILAVLGRPRDTT
jgi:hypothetical protein